MRSLRARRWADPGGFSRPRYQSRSARASRHSWPATSRQGLDAEPVRPRGSVAVRTRCLTSAELRVNWRSQRDERASVASPPPISRNDQGEESALAHAVGGLLDRENMHYQEL